MDENCSPRTCGGFEIIRSNSSPSMIPSTRTLPQMKRPSSGAAPYLSMSAALSASSAGAEQSVACRQFFINSAANLPAPRPCEPRYLLSFKRASAAFSTKASTILPSEAATSQKRIAASASSIFAA